MCKGEKTIKLCSCEGGAVDENCMWVLYSEQRRVGSFLPPSRSHIDIFRLLIGITSLLPLLLALKMQFVYRAVTDKWFVPLCAKNILKRLNQNTAFDFDYRPSLGDVLVVHFQGKEFYFKYAYSSGWSISNAREAKPNVNKSERFKGFLAEGS